MYQRRNDELSERDLDAEELFFRQPEYDIFDERSDIFDELDERGFFGAALLSVFDLCVLVHTC